jgi:hypothetical protein
MLVLAACLIIGGAVSASAYCRPVVYPRAGYVAPVVAVPFGYVTTSVSVLPVTTALAYAPYVVTAYPVAYPAPVVYAAPYVMPRIMAATCPTYAVIR